MQFISLEKWKKNTNLRCWYCTLKFKNTPWFIIENIHQTSNGLIYDILGNFCSVGCLHGHININYNTREHFDIYNSINKLNSDFTLILSRDVIETKLKRKVFFC